MLLRLIVDLTTTTSTTSTRYLSLQVEPNSFTSGPIIRILCWHPDCFVGSAGEEKGEPGLGTALHIRLRTQKEGGAASPNNPSRSYPPYILIHLSDSRRPSYRYSPAVYLRCSPSIVWEEKSQSRCINSPTAALHRKRPPTSSTSRPSNSTASAASASIQTISHLSVSSSCASCVDIPVRVSLAAVQRANHTTRSAHPYLHILSSRAVMRSSGI